MTEDDATRGWHPAALALQWTRTAWPGMTIGSMVTGSAVFAEMSFLSLLVH
ncbi:MAG: hypothetical protein NTZ77_03375 [Caldiserica bacterium]|nr:hypothetical protein [Caldisericota bacterium]